MNARHRADDGEPVAADEEARVVEPASSNAVAGPSDSDSDSDSDSESKPRPRIRRRVTTQPVPGSDPHPAAEPMRHVAGENDDQLKRDVPPHWGSD